MAWIFYLLWLPVAAACYFIAKKLQFDKKTIALLLAALALYYFHFYSTQVSDFTIDWGYHTAYIRYLAEDFWAHSSLVVTHANASLPEIFYQLPTYYILATPLYQWGDALGLHAPFEMVRHLSMLFYCGFLFFGILTLRIMVHPVGLPYYAALALLLFWPLGVTMAGRVHPDILAYFMQMGIVYHLVCWIRIRQSASLAKAFMFSGLGMLVKMPSMLYFLVALVCLAVALYQQRRHLKQFLTPPLVLAILFAVLCRYFAVTHFFALDDIALAHHVPPAWDQLLRIYTYFNPLVFVWDTMINPYMYETYPPFWPYFLRTLVVGDVITLRALVLLFVIGVLLLAMLVYVAIGFARRGEVTREERHFSWFFTLLSCILIGALGMVRYSRIEEIQFGNARYIFPLYVILILAYGKAMEWHERAGRGLTVRIGNGIALGMVLLSVGLFLMQHIFLSKPQ